MSDIVNLEKQDLINLSKVLSLDSSADAPYILNGEIRSSYQRKEKVYRLEVHDSEDVWLFIFNKHNKPVGIVHQNTLDYGTYKAEEPKLIDNSYDDVQLEKVMDLPQPEPSVDDGGPKVRWWKRYPKVDDTYVGPDDHKGGTKTWK